MNRLLVECYERCESEAQNPLPIEAAITFSAVIIKKYKTSELWDGPLNSMKLSILGAVYQVHINTYRYRG